jgi:hypothetical protein
MIFLSQALVSRQRRPAGQKDEALYSRRAHTLETDDRVEQRDLEVHLRLAHSGLGRQQRPGRDGAAGRSPGLDMPV